MRAFYRGQFSKDVAEVLQARHGAAISALDDPRIDQEIDATNGPVVFISTQAPSEKLSELGTRIVERGIDCTHVLCWDRLIFCGPVRRSGAGACLTCFDKRYLMYTQSPESVEREFAIRRLSSGPNGPEVLGHSPPLAAAAASIAANQLTTSEASPGELVAIDPLIGQVVRSQVMPLHGCSCSRNAINPDRFHDRLAQEVRNLF